MVFNGPCLIQLPKVSDPRGNLSFVEGGRHVPFDICRAYWIYDVPGGMHRDGHAFRQQLHDGTGETRYHMAHSYYGLYVPAMTWRKIDNFSTNAVVYVLSSQPYDPTDYIEDFDQYLTLKHPTS